jgi:hypothetical protein
VTARLLTLRAEELQELLEHGHCEALRRLDPQPSSPPLKVGMDTPIQVHRSGKREVLGPGVFAAWGRDWYVPSPFGAPGDRLGVRDVAAPQDYPLVPVREWDPRMELETVSVGIRTLGGGIYWIAHLKAHVIAAPTSKPLSLAIEEVRELLERGTCEVRRLVKESSRGQICEKGSGLLVHATGAPDDDGEQIVCPFGAPGAELWVRETWVHYHTVNNIVRGDGRSSSEVSDGCAGYKADGFDTIESFRDHIRLMCGLDLEAVLIKDDRWQSPITMPRWASRLTCETESVAHAKLDGVYRWVANLKRNSK